GRPPIQGGTVRSKYCNLVAVRNKSAGRDKCLIWLRLGRIGRCVVCNGHRGAGTTLQNSDTLRLTQDLIARPSVTPADMGCQQLMMRRLAAVGFANEPMNFGSVENFWATHGSGGPVLCFAGHTDVVPTGPLEEWKTDPFKPTVIDGRLYGRGAADMKSGLAAMVTATEAFVRECPDHRGTIAFLITNDVEGPSVDGTKRVGV